MSTAGTSQNQTAKNRQQQDEGSRFRDQHQLVLFDGPSVEAGHVHNADVAQACPGAGTDRGIGKVDPDESLAVG